MTKKNRTKVQFAAPKQKQAKKKPTPFADAGGIVGSKVSTMFNAPWAKGVGRWLGTGIGSIFGSGDYQMIGGAPEYNVLTNGNQIPQFHTGKQTNIVCHREYLGDIAGTATFLNSSYPLNPGVSKTFPWLSTIAQNYQEYKFHGLIFEFRSLLTDFVTSGAPGAVVMATNYNADAVVYTTKQEMENSEYAVSVKPTRDLIHGVECAMQQTVLPQLYIRTGTPPSGQDLRLYDQGNFQFATIGNPTQNLGELWVSYAVEFFKPILPNDVGGDIESGHIVRTNTSSGSPLGLIQVTTKGDINQAADPTKIGFNINEGNYYLITIAWTGSVAAVIAYPLLTFINCQAVPFWTPGASTALTVPGVGSTATSSSIQLVVLATAVGQATVTLSGAGVYPTGSTTVDITVSSYSTEAVL